MQFDVVQDRTPDGDVWLLADSKGTRVLGIVTSEALEDDSDPPQRNLTSLQKLVLATANKEAIGEVLTAKVVAGQLETHANSSLPAAIIRTGDLARARRPLRTSVLNASYSLTDVRTGMYDKS